MPVTTDFAPEIEGLAEADENVPLDVWERLWEEWVPFDEQGTIGG